MASKLDFNVILAKADKNSNQAQKLLEEKKMQLKKLQDQKKAQPSKEAAMAYLEKKKEEARKRAEQETRELLEKKRQQNKLLAEKQNLQKPPPKKHPPSASSATSKPTTKNPVQNKPSTSSKPSTSKQQQKPLAKPSKPAAKPQVQKPTLSYQDILKLADQNKDKPKTVNDKSKEPFSKIPKTNKSGAEPSASATASSSSSASSSKLTPEQIAKLKEKQRKPSSLPVNNKPSNGTIRTDINNNKNKPIEKSSDKTSSSLSHWDRIVSDMKKNPSKKANIKKNVNSNESDEGDYYEAEEEEYDSEMEDFIDDEEEDNEEYRTYIRKMFKYDPNRYKDEDEDIDNMETDYHSQLREEKRSLKLGIMEDIEEMKREAEMERRRLEKKKKRHLDSDTERSSDKKLKK